MIQYAYTHLNFFPFITIREDTHMIENKFKLIRKLFGLSQSDFARFLGVSERTVRRLESQINPQINIHISKKLYDTGINPYYINFDEPVFLPNSNPANVFKTIKSINTI